MVRGSSSWQIDERGLHLATVIIDTLIERDAAIKEGGNGRVHQHVPFSVHSSLCR
jgi:hypothetical protein